MKHGGKILVEAMQAHNLERAYSVAGESYLPVLDALVDAPEIDVVTCRQESGVTFMAEAYANLTGKPAVAMVTRGPGACNASIGVHTAHQSSTPMVVLVGLINATDKDKESFQEFDLPGMFGSISKWATVIDHVERIPYYIARAFHVAQSGRPGPVVLGLPEDMLYGAGEAPKPQAIVCADQQPNPEDLAQIREMLEGADRPLVLLGGGGWSDEGCANLVRFSEGSNIPVSVGFRRQDLFPHDHKNFIGVSGFGPCPRLVEQMKKADVVLALGTRLSEITMQGYTLFEEGQKLIHVYPCASAFGQSHHPDLAVQAHGAQVVKALADGSAIDGARWAGWRDEGRKLYEEWITPPEVSGWQGADMTQVFAHLRDVLPKDAIVTCDAGNFSGWPQRYLPYARPMRMLGPVNGAMGYAVPSAVAASLEAPGRVVVGVCGDGGFMMSAQELATAMHHGAKPIILVCNNGIYGTIRMHQERDFPGREKATMLSNPDFVTMAESYGAFAARVTDAADFPAIWEKAVKADKMALIEIVMDPRQITTQAKL